MPHLSTRAAARATLLGALTIAVAAGASRPTPLVGPPAPPIVRYAEGRVTLHADAQPLSAIFERLGQASGMRIRGALPPDHDVTVRMTDVPLRRAIERLLGSYNFTLRYGADGKPRRLTLRGAPIELTPAQQRQEAQQLRAAFFRRWSQHPPLHVSGALARTLGSSSARLPQIARSIGTQNDPLVRRQAMQYILTTVETDAVLRAGLRAMTAQQIAGFARSNARRHASELAAFLAGRARDGGVRSRAKAALASLR